MSYTPGFAPDAQSEWQELSPELHEIVLDQLDDRALNPPAVELQVTEGVLELGGVRNYLFIRSLTDHVRRRVTITGVS